MAPGASQPEATGLVDRFRCSRAKSKYNKLVKELSDRGGSRAATLEELNNVIILSDKQTWRYAERHARDLQGWLMLRLLAFIPLVTVIVVLVGISALTGRSDVLAIAIPAATPVIVMTVLGWHMARRAGERRR